MLDPVGKTTELEGTWVDQSIVSTALGASWRSTHIEWRVWIIAAEPAAQVLEWQHSNRRIIANKLESAADDKCTLARIVTSAASRKTRRFQIFSINLSLLMTLSAFWAK
jgi:hypothetical protein